MNSEEDFDNLINDYIEHSNKIERAPQKRNCFFQFFYDLYIWCKY